MSTSRNCLFVSLSALLLISLHVNAAVSTDSINYTIDNCTMTIEIARSVDKSKKIDNEYFEDQQSCGTKYRVRQVFSIPLQNVTLKGDSKDPTFECPQEPDDTRRCVSEEISFHPSNGNKVCGKKTSRIHRFKPSIPLTEKDEIYISSKSANCRDSSKGQIERDKSPGVASQNDDGDFRLIGDDYEAKGQKRVIWGRCNNGTTFNGSKWNFDNYWTVSAKTIVSESGLTMDGAVRKACRGN